jgi:hypothetical protein
VFHTAAKIGVSGLIHADCWGLSPEMVEGCSTAFFAGKLTFTKRTQCLEEELQFTAGRTMKPA